MMEFAAACVVFYVWLRCFSSGVFAESASWLGIFLEAYPHLETNSSQCYPDVLYIKNDDGQLGLLDLEKSYASSTILPNLQVGNAMDLKNWSQCHDVQSDGLVDGNHASGQYCFIFATPSQINDPSQEDMSLSKIDWSWAICKPATCTLGDLSGQLKLLDISSPVRVVFCESSSDDSNLLRVSFYLMVALLLLLVILGTYVEMEAVDIPCASFKSVLLSFSLITNWKTLSSPARDRSIGCIHGIRVISQLFILATHLIQQYYFDTSLISQINKLKVYDSWFALLFLNGGDLAVDAFFLVSGMVCALEFINERKANVRFSYFRHMAKRYIRLTPPYFVVILFYMTVAYDFGSGPSRDNELKPQRHLCLKYWWTNLLYINNYPLYEELRGCLLHTWFLAANMQMFLVAPIFLFILYRYRKCGIICVVTVCLASCVYISFYCFINNFYGKELLVPRTKDTKYYFGINLPIQTRIPPFLFGLLLGYFLDRYKKDKTRISLPYRIWSITASTLAILLAIYFQPIEYRLGSGNLVQSLSDGFHRLLFAIGLGWIIFICDQGYGGVVDSFLSHRYFEISSRLTYCFYIFQYVYLSYKFGMNQESSIFSYFSYFRDMVFGTFILVFISAAMALTVEFPFVHLNKILFKKEKLRSKATPAVNYRTFLM